MERFCCKRTIVHNVMTMMSMSTIIMKIKERILLVHGAFTLCHSDNAEEEDWWRRE